MALKKAIYRLLRRSERYTKTDMVYLAGSTFWTTLAQIVSSVAAFILSIGYANLLSKETYGLFKFVLSLFTILSISTLPGIGSSLIRSVAKKFDNSLMPALTTRMRWALLGSVVTVGIAVYNYVLGDTTLFFSLIIIAIILPIYEPFDLYKSFLVGRKDYKRSSIYWIISKIIATLVLLVTIFLTNNVLLIILGFFIPQILMNILFFMRVKAFKRNDDYDNGIIKYGKQLTLNQLISTIALYIDKLIIFMFIGPVELAIYSFALAPAEQVKSVLKNGLNFAYPKFSERSISEIKGNLYYRVILLTIALTIIAGLYIIAAPYLFHLVFPQYEASIFLSQLFALSIIGIVSMIPRSIMQSQQMTNELYKFNIYSSVAQIIMLFVFISYYGMLGAIIARVIGRFYTAALGFFYVAKGKTTS